MATGKLHGGITEMRPKGASAIQAAQRHRLLAVAGKIDCFTESMSLQPRSCRIRLPSFGNPFAGSAWS